MPKDNLKVTASISIDDLVTALSAAFAEKDNELEDCQRMLQETRDELGEAYRLLAQYGSRHVVSELPIAERVPEGNGPRLR